MTTMETYQGVKFQYSRTQLTFAYDQRLEILNQWVFLFTELGLAPLHDSGAYGNQSYRASPSSFIITRSGMAPQKRLNVENYVHITGFDTRSGTFMTEGLATPSSECFLHNALYNALPHINAVLHGHSALLSEYAEHLSIPVTKKFHEYGTPELADSALQMQKERSDFFILKDHGFVALGKDIQSAGNMTLDYAAKLIKILQNN